MTPRNYVCKHNGKGYLARMEGSAPRFAWMASPLVMTEAEADALQVILGDCVQVERWSKGKGISAADQVPAMAGMDPLGLKPAKCGFQEFGMMPACVLPAGHEGDHQDGFGGFYGCGETPTAPAATIATVRAGVEKQAELF